MLSVASICILNIRYSRHYPKGLVLKRALEQIARTPVTHMFSLHTHYSDKKNVLANMF